MEYGGKIKEQFDTIYSGGIFVFFDAYYFNLDFDLLFLNSADYVYNDAILCGIGGSFKYPFKLRSIIIYPLIGAKYHIYMTSSPEINKKDLNSFRINIGAGINYSIKKRIYVSFIFLYNLKINNAYENNVEDRFTAVNAKYSTHGPEARFAVGFNILEK
ncbi:hypothetical protein K7I13_14465 [Brucepastera parasyntrophica]|uniref:hypothetical protein n=1 Tax=Brucepastera parasyntrophica TaxID=2880008 RepID=UPI00210D31DA|nr:hypothetical protein [Brucepastera parasyntrophica]ULQ59641.1 hypothetical protein K7I13_14465 [Brucepastera parasyntrophica]